MKFNFITVFFVIISLALGYYLNTLANERNNKKLIAAFKAELLALNLSKTRVSSPSELADITLKQAQLEAQISLLESL